MSKDLVVCTHHEKTANYTAKIFTSLAIGQHWVKAKVNLTSDGKNVRLGMYHSCVMPEFQRD